MYAALVYIDLVENTSLSNVTLRSNYVVRLVRAVPAMCSDLTSDAEKPLFWCPLGHANTARSAGT